MSTLHAVELGVLGPLQVRQDGAAVPIPGAKPRAILTMLGLHSGSVVAADALLELLWGDDPPRTAAKALQTHISSLRRTLGDGFVLTEGTGWILSPTETDASRYKLAAKKGRDAAAAADTSQAVARFEEALTLWRGTPELPDTRRGLAEKTRWVESHAALVEDRADALLATGRAAEIIGELEAAVADAPLRERRWGQLMLALYRAGRQGEALGAYQRARSLLADELGVDPGPELRRLEVAIVGQDAALDVPVAQNVPSITRAVTFLLTDIEGSTAAWEADADAMAVALARHDELVEQVVTSRGGRLIKTRGEGDATFSVFDRPSAAAAAAIELQDAILHEPWALREPMRIRVALHTGEVELRDGDYFGRAVNRAARLRSLAIGGQILCSGATAELVIDSLADDVVLADLGMRHLKNLARPEHVFELRLETASDVPQPQAREEPLERPSLPTVLTGPGPFVGRGRELEGLVSVWQTAVAGGMHAVLIAGEPGVGKTRLAGEWSRRAYEQGAVVLYGRCDEDLGAPYQPFAEALRSLVPCLGAKRLRGLRGVEALLALVPGLTEVLPDLAAPTRADPDTERYALFDAVVALCELASASAPVVLILDDLHWAAKPTLLLLRHLLRFGDHARVQIVGTYRSTDLDRSHPLAAMLADLHRDGTANRLQLSGLDEDDVTAYVAEAGYDDEELARALASVTGGNPFFLIEALRHVDESGGVWDPSTLPQGVRETVSRRLSRLSAETNTALAAAAVVGSRFALDLVEQVTEQDLVDAFDEACKAGIVIEEPGGRYRFNHAIVRQSLLAELASVRRMRLHQRIAKTLEAEPGADDDELLAELAYHYFECAWAGNAAKAVLYCRRAADQAMARLGYEGAADLYDRALHALEEIDEELPDRGDQTAELLIARCEALLAAGDVASAAGAVSQLQAATVDSARLAAWATCFDGELSMLIHPERLDEIEAALSGAAETLGELADAAGEAKAHTVRAGCLARLGRIGDCEVALDDALTAARRAQEHRRVNAVLANAPLAALWGPNPVPRAGGRCLDVVRLLRITTDSPAVEATSTRCQAVLEAFRGRAAAARRMIESARRTVTELGLRHALLEVEQFAGIVELVVDDPAAAEPHLRKAYNGFRRMGLDADTAETAALLGRACLVLGRDAEADELCTESERLAGHALKPSIAWRTLRARLLSLADGHDEARRVAEAAVSLAERTDALVDHGDACLTLATVLRAGGDVAGARAAANRAVDLYERKGAAALAERARAVLGGGDVPAAAPTPETPSVELDNACVRAGERVVAAINHEAWDEFEQLFAPDAIVESRRKIVGFTQVDVPSGEWPHMNREMLEAGATRVNQVAIAAVRGERLALTRIAVGTADVSPGAPQDEFLLLYGTDEDGRVTLQVWFDVDDMDAAIAELDAIHARFEVQDRQARRPENAASRLYERFKAHFAARDWQAITELLADNVRSEDRRRVVNNGLRQGIDALMSEISSLAELGMEVMTEVVATRGERLLLSRARTRRPQGPDGFHSVGLDVVELDAAERLVAHIVFDLDDFAAAIAELDARYLAGEAAAHAQTWSLVAQAFTALNRHELPTTTPDWVNIDHRAVVAIQAGDLGESLRAVWDLTPQATNYVETVHLLSNLGAVVTHATHGTSREGFDAEWRSVTVLMFEGDKIGRCEVFDEADIDTALAKFDELSRLENACVRAIKQLDAVYDREAWDEVEGLIAPVISCQSHRKIVGLNLGDLPYAEWESQARRYREMLAPVRYRHVVLAAPGERLALTRLEVGPADVSPRAPRDELLQLYGLDEEGRIALQVWFDVEDMDAAIAELDATYARLEKRSKARRPENAASRLYERFKECYAARDWRAITEMLADNVRSEDRRSVVNSGVRQGPDGVIAEISGLGEFGIDLESEVVATRGERLALNRIRTWDHDQGPNGFETVVLDVVEIDADGRYIARIVFNVDDFDAAIEELDARYLAGEAFPYLHSWLVAAQTAAAANKQELRLTPDCVTIDHRQARAFAPGEFTEYMHATWDIAPNARGYIETVHELSNIGVVVTQVVRGSSREGFDAEWREVILATFEGDLINRCELFDESDLDAALARFDQLSRPAPQLENAATRVSERLYSYVAASDWQAVAQITAENVSVDDRRRVVSAGILHGRDANIKDAQATVDVGFTMTMLGAMATRGGRLALTRVRVSGRDPETIQNDALSVFEIDAEERIAGVVVFDLDDIDAAFEELDSRYLAGEAAPYARTWSVITRALVAHNRREIAATTPDVVTVDHRRVAAFAPGEGIEYLRAGWELDQALNIYVETVHRLNDLGAVVIWTGYGTSHEGFTAEWRGGNLFAVDGAMVSRAEVFDEEDLDDALAKFDQLSPPAPQLENAASRLNERFLNCLAARDWDAMAELMVVNFRHDDRRPVVGAGVRHGRDPHIADMRAVADLWNTNLTSTVVATRGERLVLMHIRMSDHDQGPEVFLTEVLGIIELDADQRAAAVITFGVDDVDAAVAELDARYLAGEAAAHAHAWSVIVEAYAGFNRRELSATAPDWVNIDHRRGAAFAPGDMIAYLKAAWDDSPDTKIYIAAVHRLSNIGAVVTHVAHGISQEGFDAEWRDIHVLGVTGDMLSRSELFDAADLDAALARFNELSAEALPRKNGASHVVQRVFTFFGARDWTGMAELVAEDICSEDRRSAINAGIRHGRVAEIADMRAIADVGVARVIPTVIATRGQHLTLCHVLFPVEDQEPGTFRNEALLLVEINADNQVTARLLFDLDDFDAAIKELDTRYSAGEAATCSRTWSVIARSYYETNRRELPGMTPDSVFIDHRAVLTTEREHLAGYLRSMWDLMPDMSVYIESVHALSDVGAVVTQATRGTSREGLGAEWRAIAISTLEGDLYSRVEAFDETDLDAALARFEELHLQTLGLQNAASRVCERLRTSFAARDWDTMANLFAADIYTDDRRPIVGAGIRRGRDAEMASMRATAEVGTKNISWTALATRGENLVLSSACFSGHDQASPAFRAEVLSIVETNADNMITAVVVMGPDDIDAAFEELECRYLSGEAAAHADTWSVIAGIPAAFTRHELFATTPDHIYIDHRPLVSIKGLDVAASMRAVWDITSACGGYFEAVHRLSELGAVITLVLKMTTQEGFDAELRMIELLTVERDLISRVEVFDEADLDAALARFDELHSQTQRLENTASRVYERFQRYFGARDWPALAEMLTDEFSQDDRRRVVGAGVRRGRDAQMADIRAFADLGATTSTATVIATRGDRLVLCRTRISYDDQQSGAFHIEFLSVIEIDADERIITRNAYDLDQIESAFAELDRRYLAGEGVAHSHTWSVIAEGYRALNRREKSTTTADYVQVDHRLRATVNAGDLDTYLRTTWELMPDLVSYIEAVHRVTDLGAVVTHAGYGTSSDGFDAEWREIDVLTIEGDLFSSCEMFDDTDVDAALARFDELQPAMPRLENAATRTDDRLFAYCAVGDWAAIGQILADDSFVDDRRRVVNAGFWDGRDVVIANLRALAEGLANVTSTVIATRGERLALTRICSSSRDLAHEEFDVEMLGIVELGADERIAGHVLLGPDDVDAAFTELDARYVAGEAADCRRTWTAIAGVYTSFNRHELPAATPDWFTVDRRPLATFEYRDPAAFFDATWDLTPQTNIYIEDVHRLNNFGAIVTHAVYGTSQEGFEAEWRQLSILTVAGDLIDRCEVFDEGDLNAALARFDQLSVPKLQNPATRTRERQADAINFRDVDRVLALATADARYEDRRKSLRDERAAQPEVVRAIFETAPRGWLLEVAHIAIRGSRLALTRDTYRDTEDPDRPITAEHLMLTEVTADGLMRNAILFDPDDINGAIAELTARWIASGEVAYPQVIDAERRLVEATNRHDWDALAQIGSSATYISHLQLADGGTGTMADQMSSIQTMASLIPDLWLEPAEILTHSASGVVAHMVEKGTSTDGVAIELPFVIVILFDGECVTRVEAFDLDQRDLALARFEELGQSG